MKTRYLGRRVDPGSVQGLADGICHLLQGNENTNFSIATLDQYAREKEMAQAQGTTLAAG
jgi:hypothetical protein